MTPRDRTYMNVIKKAFETRAFNIPALLNVLVKLQDQRETALSGKEVIVVNEDLELQVRWNRYITRISSFTVLSKTKSGKTYTVQVKYRASINGNSTTVYPPGTQKVFTVSHKYIVPFINNL